MATAAGLESRPIQWPVPLKLDEPGGIQIYGYHDEVLLLVQLTPPPKIDTASVHLAAETSWLVCEKICIPGGTRVQLDLPVGSPATPANAELFAKYRERLPRRSRRAHAIRFAGVVSLTNYD